MVKTDKGEEITKPAKGKYNITVPELFEFQKEAEKRQELQKRMEGKENKENLFGIKKTYRE